MKRCVWQFGWNISWSKVKWEAAVTQLVSGAAPLTKISLYSEVVDGWDRTRKSKDGYFRYFRNSSGQTKHALSAMLPRRLISNITTPQRRSKLKGSAPCLRVCLCMHMHTQLYSRTTHACTNTVLNMSSSVFCSCCTLNHHAAWSLQSTALIKISFEFPQRKMPRPLWESLPEVRGLRGAREVSSACFDLNESLTWITTPSIPQHVFLCHSAHLPSHSRLHWFLWLQRGIR